MIPYKSDHPETTYKRYFLSKDYNLNIYIPGNRLVAKKLFMRCFEPYTELDPSQFTKEKYMDINNYNNEAIKFIDINGKEVVIDFSQVLHIGQDDEGCLHIVVNNEDYISNTINIKDIDDIIKKLGMFSIDSEFVQKYKRIICKDFVSFTKEDIILLSNAYQDILEYRKMIDEKCKAPTFHNKLERYVYEYILSDDYKCKEYYLGNIDNGLKYKYTEEITERFEEVNNTYRNNFIDTFKKTDIFEHFTHILCVFDYDLNTTLDDIERNRISEEWDYNYNEMIDILFERAEKMCDK